MRTILIEVQPVSPGHSISNGQIKSGTDPDLNQKRAIVLQCSDEQAQALMRYIAIIAAGVDTTSIQTEIFNYGW